MARKEFTFRGKTMDELRALSLAEFGVMVPARARRSLKRGFTPAQKIVLKKIACRLIAKNITLGSGLLVTRPHKLGLTGRKRRPSSN